MKLKICHITFAYWPAVGLGGQITAVMGMSKAQAKNHNVVIITTKLDSYGKIDSKLLKEEYYENIKIFRIPTLFKIFNFVFTQNFEKILERVQPDIIHIHSYFSQLSIKSIKYAKKYNIPIVFSPHGSFEKELYKSRNQGSLKRILYYFYNIKYASLFYKESDLTIIASEEERESLLISGKKVRKHYFGISNTSQLSSETDIRKKLDIRQNCQILLYSGRIIESKGVVDLVFAFKELLKVNRNVILLLIGPIHDILLQRIKEIGLEEIHLLGVIDHQELTSIYPQVDLFISLSPKENFGLSNIESLWHGTPIVSRKTGIIMENNVLNKIPGIFIIKHFDNKKIAKELNEILKIIITLDKYDIKMKTMQIFAEEIISNKLIEDYLSILR